MAKRLCFEKVISLVVPPNGTHIIENTGNKRLYTLTVLVTSTEFAELIYSGTPTELDAEDLAVLQRKALPISG